MNNLHGWNPFRRTYNSRGTSVIVHTDLAGKETHRQVGVGKVIASGSLGCIVVNVLAPKRPDMWVQILLKAQYFPFSSSLMTLSISVILQISAVIPTTELGFRKESMKMRANNQSINHDSCFQSRLFFSLAIV